MRPAPALALALVAIALSGCGTIIVLHNPGTGATVTCDPDGGKYFNPAAAAESCARGYEVAGFKRVNSY